jgi:hypothetical protein
VSERGDYSRDAAVFRTADDRLVVEVRLRGCAQTDLRQLIEEARASGADALWVHGLVIDAALGFEQRGGYARLVADHLPPPLVLGSAPHDVIRELQIACYSGVWGHSDPGEPDGEATFVALREGERWIGVCEFDAVAGWIESPGVVPELRSPDRYAQLVRGAVAHMRPGPITLDTWGDSDETIAAYRRLGFEVVEYVPGWELQFGIRRVP